MILRNYLILRCQKKPTTGETNMDTTIFLTPQDVELFKEFRQHQTEFMILKSHGIFDFKGGVISVHKDADGRVRKIEVNKITLYT